MAGFADFDAYLNALTVSEYGQELGFQKNASFTTVAGTHNTLWATPGLPTTGVYTGSADTAVQATSSTTGALYFANATSPRKLFMTAIEALIATTGMTGTLIVLDRLLYYPGIDHADATHPLTNGVALSRYTTGRGVMAFLEVTTALGVTARNATLTYTDQSGNSSTSATIAITASASAQQICHAPLYFPLAAGDYGIRSVTDLTFSGTNSGISCLVLAKELARIPIGAAFQTATKDLLRSGVGAPQIADNACLMFLFLPAAAVATPSFNGTIYACEN